VVAPYGAGRRETMFNSNLLTFKREKEALASGACGCLKCTQERVAADPFDGEDRWEFDHRLNRMFLCPTCGNKRCPRAHDHANTCTNSNEPGQKGSLYE
jgi:hypothetical protein